MSDGRIINGWGKPIPAKVLTDGSQKVFATSEDLLQAQLRDGESFYISAGAENWHDGTASTSELIFFEFYNNTPNDLLVKSAQVWASPAYTTGPYTETTDQTIRFNQWLQDTPYLNTAGKNGIDANLNRTSTETLPVRDNGNSAVRVADLSHAVAIPAKTKEEGYICGFMTASSHGKAEMLPGGQGIIIGRNQSWLVSFKPVQNSSPTNQIIGCRASVVNLANVGE